MTSKLKCPFCGEELIMEFNRDRDTEIYHCDNCYFQGDGIIWQALIQTKQELEIAKNALKKIQTAQGRCWGATDTEIKNDCKYYAYKALEQIEHKE